MLRANLLQLGLFAKLAKDFVGADVVFLDPIVIIINCHELYEANVVRSVKSQARQIQNFIGKTALVSQYLSGDWYP